MTELLITIHVKIFNIKVITWFLNFYLFIFCKLVDFEIVFLNYCSYEIFFKNWWSYRSQNKIQFGL